MKIRSCATPANKKKVRSGLRRILCSFLFIAAVVAAAGAVTSPPANQGGSTSLKAMANLADGVNSNSKTARFSQRMGDSPRAPLARSRRG